MAGAPPDDRRPVALEGTRREVGAAAWLGSLRLPTWLAALDRSRFAEARFAARGAGEEGLRALDPGGLEVLEARLQSFQTLTAREPHAQASAHRSTAVQRHRQRLLGRDPVAGAVVADRVTQKLKPDEWQRLHDATGTRSATGSMSCRAKQATSSRRRSPPSAQAWPCMAGKAAVSALRHTDPAHSLRRQRDQLLPPLPDRGQSCWPTALCRDCSRETGRRRRKNWRI